MKVIVVGLDAATWDILNSIIKNGQMPNLRFLMRKGAVGVLESTI